ncbi:hypothetical protein C3L33_01464, partial [Rhododendron williamsianum]
MSAKLPHSLMDENPDFQKQIGCMSGIFLMFDRRYFLSGGRITSHNHKRLPPGVLLYALQTGANACLGIIDALTSFPYSQFLRRNVVKVVTMEWNRTEKHLEKGVKEKRRVSSESSTTSFSSSSVHLPSPQNLSRIPPVKHPDPSPHLRQQSTDLRDVVEDVVCKETHELSVKTTTKAKGVSRVVKNVDSPRPPKDAPRFSYDERVSRDKWKSATKLKELPRLSLDSRRDPSGNLSMGLYQAIF